MRQEKDRQKRRAEQGECELCKRSLRGRIARCGQCAAAEEEEARRRRDEAAELAEERQRELEERMAEVDAELTRCSRAERAMKRAKELAAEGERAEGRARELNDEATRLARENAKRREGIERARRSVSLEVSERQEAMLPEGIRGQAMALRARNEAACEAMARTLRSIHLALPLRADSGRRGGPSGARACGLRVPMPNDFTGVPNHEAATALGYLLISLRLLSVALDSPVVHDGGFQGSTSFAWLPATVATPLPLHMHQPPMEGRLDRASPCPPPRSLQASTSRAAAYRRVRIAILPCLRCTDVSQLSCLLPARAYLCCTDRRRSY